MVEYVDKGYYYEVLQQDGLWYWRILRAKKGKLVGYYYHLTLYKSRRSAIRAAVKWVSDQ